MKIVKLALPFIIGISIAAWPKNSMAEGGSLGLRADCVTDFNKDKGSSQDCMSISGLRYNFFHKASAKASAQIVLDPFASATQQYARTPRRDEIPLVKDTDMRIVDHYAFVWTPRPHLSLAIESYGGIQPIPSTSELDTASLLAWTGWKQTAITATYNLAAFRGTRVKFVVGNGEGENGENRDPQQFFAFEVNAQLIDGLKALMAVSFDGNSVGSASHAWQQSQYQSNCQIDPIANIKQGYSTQVIGAGLELDGRLAAARGLKMGLGWQRNVAADLNKEKAAYPTIEQLRACSTLDPNVVFAEDPDGNDVNTVQRTVLGFNFSYRILDTYFLGFDYETLRIDSGSVDIFELCEGFEDEICLQRGETSNSLGQTAMSFGGGLDLDDALRLTLSYHTINYDDSYSQFYYLSQDGKADDSLELFNIRMAYNWQ